MMAAAVARKESNDPVRVGMMTTSCSLLDMAHCVGATSSAKRLPGVVVNRQTDRDQRHSLAMPRRERQDNYRNGEVV